MTDRLAGLVIRHFTLIRVSIAVIIGLLLAFIFIFAVSDDPGAAIVNFLFGPLLSRNRFFNVLETASPIIFCGLAISIAFTARQFNIGAAGALYLGAAVGTAFAVSTGMHPLLHIPLTLMVAAVTGGIWGAIPGFLRARWNASELVASLMLNYVAYFLGLYLINFHFRDKSAGFMVSFHLPDSTILPLLVANSRLHIGVLLSPLCALLIYFYFYRTTMGYELRMTGHNNKFARYGGVNVFKVIVVSQMLLGVFAATGGMVEVMGVHHRFLWQDLPTYGWDGIVAAIIAGNHPLLIVPTAFFLAYLRTGGQVLNLLSDVPAEMVLVIQAIIILFVTAEAFLRRWRDRLILTQAAAAVEPNRQPPFDTAKPSPDAPTGTTEPEQ